MPTFFTPVVFEGPHYSRRDSRPRWKRDFLARCSRPLTGINLYVLKDEFVSEYWPKIGRNQPPPEWVEREYLGARYHSVTDDEAAFLRSHGYSMLGDEE